MENGKEHWEKVYSTKQPHEMSWTQDFPKTSLELIHSCNLPKSASIIDVGGGDSKLVDYLLEEGYINITVLDISETAIEKAKQRIGKEANRINWIIDDVTKFQPAMKYDIWHDRATFHFLLTTNDIKLYLKTAREAVNSFMIIGTYSDKGPSRCSMLDVHRYTERELQRQLKTGFEKIKCISENHVTPFNTIQNFLFCSFQRINNN
jgi:uncharacterized UPF0146 family protein